MTFCQLVSNHIFMKWARLFFLLHNRSKLIGKCKCVAQFGNHISQLIESLESRIDSGRRLDLELISEIPLDLSRWKYYELKRHHKGKSFQTRVQQCFHYCFRFIYFFLLFSTRLVLTIHWSCRKTTSDRAINHSIMQQIYSTPLFENVTIPTQTLFDGSGTPSKTEKKKKRRVHELVEGQYDEISSTQGGQKEYRCKNCSKSYPTEQVM